MFKSQDKQSLHNIPISSSVAVLLDLFGIGIGKPALCKVAGQIFSVGGGAFSNALVVTVVGLVRAGH